MTNQSKPKYGKHYALVLYRHTADRIWQLTLPLGGLLGILWWQLGTRTVTWFNTKAYDWVLVAAVLSLAFSFFALVGRNLAYVQPRSDHLRLSTPFLRLKISYRRVRQFHPVNFASLFPPAGATPAEKTQLVHQHHQTAIVVELNGYPTSPKLLRLFLPREMFSPQAPGFVFLVPNWMAFSTELDMFVSSWRQSQPVKQGF